MFIKLISILLFPILLTAVSVTKAGQNEIIRYTKKVVEHYQDGKVRKDIIEYQYEKPDDIFWKKEIQKDEEGTVLRVTERVFNRMRFPMTEIVTDELGTQSERYMVRYSPDNLQLLEKTEYEGEFSESNKVSYVAYHYKNDYLAGEDFIKYSRPGFKNIDGDNIEYSYKLRFILPEKNRPKGSHEVAYYIEKRKMYYTPQMAEDRPIPGLKAGDVVLEEYTEFDNDGFPKYYKKVNIAIKDEHAEHRPVEEWFKVEKSPEDGRILCITGFEDKNFTKNSFETAKIYYSYDKNGWVSKIEEWRFNDTTKQFNLLHDVNSYMWFTPKVDSKYDFTLYTENNEHRCYHGFVHSFTNSEISKYDKGEILLTESSASYKLGKAPKKPKFERNKKTSYKYEVIKN